MAIKFLKEKGTLMIEMIILIGFIGILLTLGVPYIRNFLSNLKLHNALKQISMDLRWTQQLSVSEQKIHYTLFSIAENSYQIIRQTDASIIKEENLPANISFQAISFTDNKVIFNYYGAAVEAGTIVLRNSQTGKTGTVEVKASGYVNYVQ